MKHNLLLLGLMMIALPAVLVPVNVNAHDFEVDGIYYNVVGPSQLAVTCRDYDSEGLTYSGNLVIPATVEHDGVSYTVTTIGPDAFFKAKRIWSLTIPSTITDIYWDAFMESFASPIIVSDLETWCRINFHVDCSFSQGEPDLIVDSHSLVTGQDMVNLVIPPSVTEIHDFTFYNTGSIRNVVIPDHVTKIGKGAFAVCTYLKSVKIGSHVTFIGGHAFDICNVRYWGTTWYDEDINIIDEITCIATVPPVVENKYTFTMGIYKNTVLRVPAESLDAYRAAEYWNQFVNIEAIPGKGPGDVNGDNGINVMDVTSLIDELLNDNVTSPYADVNGDGRVDVRDVTGLVDKLLND